MKSQKVGDGQNKYVWVPHHLSNRHGGHDKYIGGYAVHGLSDISLRIDQSNTNVDKAAPILKLGNARMFAARISMDCCTAVNHSYQDYNVFSQD